jgi:tRNA modification GTPase
MDTAQDTIVAVATPTGEGAIGIIRLSGAQAIAITAGHFAGKNLTLQPSHTLHHGRIMDGADTIDDVVVSLYRNPKSYTGEDVVEISCHGSAYILQKVVGIMVAAGARPAKPGEFTQRAFLNGKMDLTQAEAVADVIAVQSAAAHRAAMHNLRGGFAANLQAMRESLIRFGALMELELDFSEEDVEFADRRAFYLLLAEMTEACQKLVGSFRLGNVIKNGVKVAIVGKPNAGKSTLLNVLLNEERAIVSDIAGTTRDTIEEVLNINGILFRLIDTAGIRDHSGDAIEMLGMERSRAAMQQADIPIYLFDTGSFTKAEMEVQKTAFAALGMTPLFVGNKTDSIGLDVAIERFGAPGRNLLYISARTGNGIDQLRETLYAEATAGADQREGTIITNVRHHAALTEVLKSLTDIRTGLDAALPSDLITPDIRRALYYLGEITGAVSNEDLLDYIFSKFCIGK